MTAPAVANDVWKKIALFLLGVIGGSAAMLLGFEAEISDLRAEVAEMKGILRATVPAVFTTGPTYIVTTDADSVEVDP